MLEIFKDFIPQHSSSQVLEWHASPSGLWLLPNDLKVHKTSIALHIAISENIILEEKEV